jgi:hypothetical protein
MIRRNHISAILIVIVSISSLVIARSASATAVAILETPKEIVVAADSRSVDEAGKPKPDECKIREVDGAFFVVNGLSRDTASQPQLNVISLATDALTGGGSLGERVARFDGLILTPLQAAVDRIMKSDSEGKTFLLNGSALGINFFAFEDGAPILYNRRYTISRISGKIQSEEHQCPGADCSRGRQQLLIRPPAGPQDFEARHPNLLDENLVQAARLFVQEQVDAKLPDVGLPIDIVQLTVHGTNWIDRKLSCQ